MSGLSFGCFVTITQNNPFSLFLLTKTFTLGLIYFLIWLRNTSSSRPLSDLQRSVVIHNVSKRFWLASSTNMPHLLHKLFVTSFFLLSKKIIKFFFVPSITSDLIFSDFRVSFVNMVFFTAGTVLQSGGCTWSNNTIHLMNTSVFLAAKQDLEIFPAYLTHSLKKHVSNESKKQVSWSFTGPLPRKWLVPSEEAAKGEAGFPWRKADCNTVMVTL